MKDKDKKPLISVIVPIYNVAPYLRKCLDSLKGQTLKQIEVICIDDGSTDSSGKIAEEYECDEWPFFRVIHTKNKGLSAARNRGIDEAQADWLMFVDSDDWVEPGFCEIPYEAAIENHADLVVFSSDSRNKEKIMKSASRNRPVGVIDEITAHEYGGWCVWNKLYRRDLYRDIRYPNGRVFEDIATTHILVHKAARIVSLQDILYHYYDRIGSICHTHTRNNRIDWKVAVFVRCRDLISYGYSEEKLKLGLYSSAIGILANTKPGKGEYHKQAKEILYSLDRIPNKMSVKKKIALRAWKIDERLFYLICRITGRIGNRRI